MNYKEILLMILNSDDKLSKEYAPILKDIDTQILPDISNIDDTCSFVRTGKGFIAVYMDGGDVIMEYVYGGTGSFKSCTKLIEFVFNPNLEYELPNLKTAKLNNSEFNDYSIDDFCNEYGDCISKYDENPFNNFSQLDPGTYNSETDEFTTDDDIDSDNELFGL